MKIWATSAYLVTLASLLAGPSPAFGQTKPVTLDPLAALCAQYPRGEVRAYCEDLVALQNAVNNEKAKEKPNLSSQNPTFDDSLRKLDITTPEGVVKFITATAVTFAATSTVSSALQSAGQARKDQQRSTDGSASGTTSLVSKAGSAELLSLALDTGVLTQSVNGTTSTLSTNADQVFRLVTKSDPDCIVTSATCKSRGWFETWILTPTNVSASLDLAQQNSKTTASSGQASGTMPTSVSNVSIPTGAGKLSEFTVRYQVRNKFDPRSEKFKAAWGAQVTSQLKAKVTAIGGDTDAVKNALASHKHASAVDKDKLVEAADSDKTGEALFKAFAKFWDETVTADITNDRDLASSVSKVIRDRAVYRDAWFQALDQAAGTLLTFEYNYNRPVNQPQTHDVKLIYGYDFGAAGMLTFNGSTSFYGTIPAGAKYGSLHYGQVSAEYDQTMTGKDKSTQTQLSLAGYWQYQPHASILNIPAGTVAPGTNIPLPNGTQEFVGTAGSLWVTQVKLTIKASGGINIPIGVSWSNKTDLLQGSKVGAQVGISYNFSSLAGLFTGGTSQ
ncbi:MAG TPA: hypothetical protein VI386_28450 [Candidatus Sulfotelmatobacter sp.]